MMCTAGGAAALPRIFLRFDLSGRALCAHGLVHQGRDGAAACNQGLAAQATFPRHLGCAGVCLKNRGIDPTGYLCHVLLSCSMVTR